MSSKKLVTSAQAESLRTMANAKGISREVFQKWLDTEASNILSGLKETVRIGKVICRHVIVNRDQLPHDAINAIKRDVIINDDVVKTMPKGNGTEVDVFFFQIGRYINNDIELEKEYEKRGFVPVDPYTLAKVNEDDPTFADEYPHGTHWKNANSEWCFAVFCYSRGLRLVRVDRNDRSVGWDSSFWFAGLRKAS